MKKKIIITGISSQLMQDFSQEIDFNKYDVYGLSRNISTLSINNVKLVKADILDLSSVEELFKDASLIIHAAAITHANNTSHYFETNTKGTQNLVDILNKNHKSKFVFISSNTASKTGGAYAKSKYLAEQIIINQCDHYLILRPSEIFGGIKNEGIDQLIHDAFHKSTMLIPSGMKYNMTPIHIDDVISLFSEYIFSNKKEDLIQSITGDKQTSIKDIVGQIGRLKNNQITQIRIPKFIMMIIKQILILTRINMGIVPDQIDRLYGPKSYAHGLKTDISLVSYLKSYSAN